MNHAINDLQLQFRGYLSTPLLWEERPIFELRQLDLPERDISSFTGNISDNLVLGKRVEQFVLAEFRQINSLEIILKNVQIQDEKVTIGEIDCIISYKNIVYHIEIIFKFYLFDPEQGDNEIDHWIGPNRKDSLAKKLCKLKDKQLPLLQNIHTSSVLSEVNLNVEEIEQRVFFKAQLFTPYEFDVEFELLNQKCVEGFYISFTELSRFSTCEFYLPIKFDWLIKPYDTTDWIAFDQFSYDLDPLLRKKKSQLCWIKFPDGFIQKLFVVWW